MSVLGSIASLLPPELAAVTRAAVVKFRDDLYRYRAQCEEIYNNSEGGQFHYTSTWSMIKMDVLQSMYGCGAFDSMEGMRQPQTVEEVTDRHIEKFLERRSDAGRRDLPQRVKAAVSSYHVRADAADPEGTVYSYLGAVYKNLDKQGALSVLDDASGVKRILKLLTEKLSPPVSRTLSRTLSTYGQRKKGPCRRKPWPSLP
jgi:hypothetical protein